MVHASGKRKRRSHRKGQEPHQLPRLMPNVVAGISIFSNLNFLFRRSWRRCLLVGWSRTLWRADIVYQATLWALPRSPPPFPRLVKKITHMCGFSWESPRGRDHIASFGCLRKIWKHVNVWLHLSNFVARSVLPKDLVVDASGHAEWHEKVGKSPGYEQLSSLKSYHFLNESLDLRKGNLNYSN